MDNQNYFSDKNLQPGEEDLKKALGDSFGKWKKIEAFVLEKYPGARKEWNFPGKNYGWNFRIKDKRRAIIYLLPREGYFIVAFVFGQKAYDQIMASDMKEAIKEELKNARKYAEGRGIQIEVRDNVPMNDVFKLIEIKLKC